MSSLGSTSTTTSSYLQPGLPRSDSSINLRLSIASQVMLCQMGPSLAADETAVVTTISDRRSCGDNSHEDSSTHLVLTSNNLTDLSDSHSTICDHDATHSSSCKPASEPIVTAPLHPPSITVAEHNTNQLPPSLMRLTTAPKQSMFVRALFSYDPATDYGLPNRVNLFPLFLSTLFFSL
ncbi:unnamed protein product [Protopolystoma xenopodis]|uniref:Uncharacterized protein n=1 Tax=Protopolystoma xenopodis TaxID=117903 RepID=A0A3S5FCI3_9PLAT|nr:unnamed protein product [Protopolystoma xenopodis]